MERAAPPLPPTPASAMVIAAHPDDAEFLAGATVAGWVAAGAAVTYVIVTNGDKGSEDPDVTSAELAAIRRREQCEAARHLGVRDVVFLDYADGMLEPTIALRRDLARLIRQHRPEVVASFDPQARFIQENYPNHPDHRATGDAALDAVFPAARDRLTFPELMDEGLAPHKVAEMWLFAPLAANHWVNVEPWLEQKVCALLQHRSQIDAASLREMLDGLHADFAAGGPYHAAESFRRVIFE